jgi:hypothetical protein
LKLHHLREKYREASDKVTTLELLKVNHEKLVLELKSQLEAAEGETVAAKEALEGIRSWAEAVKFEAEKDRVTKEQLIQIRERAAKAEVERDTAEQ